MPYKSGYGPDYVPKIPKPEPYSSGYGQKLPEPLPYSSGYNSDYGPKAPLLKPDVGVYGYDQKKDLAPVYDH